MDLFRRPGTPPRMKALPQGRPTVVSVLDIGTSKMCCIVARLVPQPQSAVLPGRTHAIEVLGLGHTRSAGVKGGKIVDVERAELAVRQAVEQAERQADLTVTSLIVNVSCGRIGSAAFSTEIELGGREIEGADIRAVLQAGASEALEGRGGAIPRIVLHSLPIGYRLDGEGDVRDPRGMAASRLGVDMHVVDAEAAPARNLEIAVNRAHLSVDAMVASPFASGLSALVEDEALMGCAVIDMGAGTTTLSVFLHGRFVFADAVAVGGAHVTMDLARGLSTRVEDAERIKVLHGCVVDPAAVPASFEEDTVSVPPMSDEGCGGQAVSRLDLARIIGPRVDETLELMRDRLVRSGFAAAVNGRVVLTGGAAMLPGLPQAAERILAARVRVGRPLGLRGLPPAAKGPAFATAAGMLIYPQVAGEEFAAGAPAPTSGTEGPRPAAAGGTFSRWGAWLKTI